MNKQNIDRDIDEKKRHYYRAYIKAGDDDDDDRVDISVLCVLVAIATTVIYWVLW